VLQEFAQGFLSTIANSKERSRWVTVAKETVDTEQGAPQVRIRRPSAVVRGLLLDSARNLFATRGYAGASTREIAEQAGVREALIFRHFGNKAGLFRAAVVDPFRGIIEGFVDDWEATHESNTMTTYELTGAWITLAARADARTPRVGGRA